MKSLVKAWLPLAILIAAIGADTGRAQPSATAGIEGRWSGMLPVSRSPLRLVLSISRTATGQLQASVAGLDTGNASDEVDSIEQSGRKLKLVVGAVGGGFQGMLSDDGNRLTGEWSEIAITTPLEFVRAPAMP